MSEAQVSSRRGFLKAVASGTRESASEVAFLRDRLRLFGLGGAAFPLLQLLVVAVGGAAAGTTGGKPLLGGAGAMSLMALGGFVLSGVLAHFGPRSATFLRFVDALGLVLVVGLPPFAAYLLAIPGHDGFVPLLGLTNIVLWRAATVPSHPTRTLLLTLGCALCNQAPAIIAPSVACPESLDVSARLSWIAVALAVATTASQIIFGLFRRARRAESLGQYRLERRVGGGGMGEVYLARHALLSRPAAVKILRPDSRDGEALARFEREVQITSTLTHPNTIQVFDYGRTPDGSFYYAMEFLEGTDLERILKVHGAMPPGRVIHVLRQACGALCEAHRAGLVHRDVKPANLILCERGGIRDFVKVVDFGLVKPFARGAGPAITGEATILGTPLYLSPEAIRAQGEIDGRSDLYSLGVLAWEMLTGRRLFEGESMMDILSQHLKSVPMSPSQVTDREIPEDLEALVMSLLAKRPQDRPATAGEVERALAACRAAGTWTQDLAEAWWASHPPELVSVATEDTPSFHISVMDAEPLDGATERLSDGREPRSGGGGDPATAGATGRAPRPRP